MSAVGILGATVMPHSLFLGSALATQDRLSSKSLTDAISQDSEENPNSTASSHVRQALQWLSASVFRASPVQVDDDAKPKCHADRENKPLSFVQAHLSHGMVDMTISLLGVAVVINSLYVFALIVSTLFELNAATIGY